jgi:cytochrome P450
MLNTDPPDHARLRRSATGAFHTVAMERLRPRLADYAHSLLDAAQERRELDVLSGFASPLAAQSLVLLLGIQEVHAPAFERMARNASSNLDPLAAPMSARRGSAAANSLRDYFASTLDERPSTIPQTLLDPLLTALAASTITRDEIVDMLVLFVIGGYEPTAHLVGNGLLALLREPDQLQLLYRQPQLIASGLDELIRYDSPIQMAMRIATTDVEIHSKTIRSGAAVVILLGAANRDPERFAEPDRLILNRTTASHLGFGAGAHMCLGAELARLVAQVAIETLVRRTTMLTLAKNRVDWLESLVPRGLKTLRVSMQ